MSTVKPTVSEAAVLELLGRCFHEPIVGLQPLVGGQIARAFAFRAGGGEYVIRFNTNQMDANFEKEAYIARVFGSPAVPIPTVVAVGWLGDLCYCISRKANGRRLNELTPEELQRALPAVMETLTAIHRADVSQTQGYGLFDGQGKGLFASWPDALRFVREEERAEGFYGKWHSLFATTFLERSVFDAIFARMESLLAACPQTRSLVHGGYGFGNLLVADGQVTAVLDWIDAKYGDFLYDVAWLDFWDPGRGYGDLFATYFAQQGVETPNFGPRLLCCQCNIALDAMRFFAKTDQPDAYRWATERIHALLADGGRVS